MCIVCYCCDTRKRSIVLRIRRIAVSWQYRAETRLLGPKLTGGLLHRVTIRGSHGECGGNGCRIWVFTQTGWRCTTEFRRILLEQDEECA